MNQGNNFSSHVLDSNLSVEMNPQLINAWLEKHMADNAISHDIENNPSGKTMICWAQWG